MAEFILAEAHDGLLQLVKDVLTDGSSTYNVNIIPPRSDCSTYIYCVNKDAADQLFSLLSNELNYSF